MVGESEREGDVVFRDEGRPVLLVGEHVSSVLAAGCLVVDGAELKVRWNITEA